MGLDLVTLAEYKAYKGLTNPNEDTALTALITKASSLVKTICRRSFIDYVDEAKTEYYKGGSSRCSLNEYPVLSVLSVEYSDDYGKTYTLLEEYVDYVLDPESAEIVFIQSPYNSDTTKVNKFKVTYTAGFESVPEDLKLAVFDIVTYYTRNDGALHTQRNPGSNTVMIDYITNNRLPAHIARVLELHMAHYG